MKVLIINVVCGIRSTGRICTDLAAKFEAQGDQVKIAYGRESVPEIFQQYAVKIGTDIDVKLHGFRSRVLDESGFGSVGSTKWFLRWADQYDPDLVWLHNIHGYYINIQLLFDWIKSRPNMKVNWTLHDCWTFTGHCAHFEGVSCEKWKQQCHHCPLKKSYPASLFKDNSSINYEKKRTIFTGVKNLTIITPSEWLADLVRQSYLNEYTVEVCNNTIDEKLFRPGTGDFRKKHGLEGKIIILGVASAWSESKGLSDFYHLSDLLDDRYRIVLVGLTKKQLRKIPDKVLGIERTDSKAELAEIYSAADIFFNPTYDDTYPTVNLEAEACGTRVITYQTGGAPETIKRKDSLAIPKGEYKMVRSILENEPV